ncbi:MAG: hypothetical protein P3X24_001365 [bacterium]|nr:hypothetical protein [bacterium]
MKYITLRDAAKQLNIAAAKLLEWAQRGYLSLCAARDTHPKFSQVAAVSRPNLTLYCLADDIEELQEDLSWSRLGLHMLAQEDDEPPVLEKLRQAVGL